MADTAQPEAGILGRVSKLISDDARSITEQKDAGRADCVVNGWRVAAEYEDAVGASRFTVKQREDWPRLQADIESGRLDVVVMWEPSRGSREPEDWFGFLRRCREHRVLIHVTSHGRTYDMTNARDWRSLAEDGVDSAYEVEKLSGRVRRGLAANRVNGKPHGRILYGYERAYGFEGGKRKLIEQRPHLEQSAVCAEIIRRAAAAEPVSAIQADLNRRKVPSALGGRWSRHQVRSVAINPAYIGKLRNGTELVDAIWPAIVDEVTFWAAHRHLTAPERKTTKPGKARWLMSYIASCGVCEAVLYAQAPTGRHRSPYYTCSGSHCTALSVAAMDSFIEKLVIARCSKTDIYDRLVQGSDQAAVAARGEAEELQARLRTHRSLSIRGEITPESFAVIEQELKPMIDAAERRAAQLAVPLPLRDLTAPGTDVKARWGGMEVAAQREVVRLLLASVVLMPAVRDGQRLAADDRVRIEWKREFGE